MRLGRFLKSHVGPRGGWLLAIFANLFLLAPAYAQADPDGALLAAERGTVRIIALYLDEAGQLVSSSSGSGFVVADGHVVTNAHVVATDTTEASLVFVIPDRGSGGEGVRGTVLGGSRLSDIAIVSAPDLVAPALPITRALPSKNGTVHALGYPGVTDNLRQLEIEEILRPAAPYVTGGSIALFSDVGPGGRRFPTIFHTAPINRGNSGGPLVDACGRVIGVNTWMAAATVSLQGLEVPSGQFIANRVANVLPQLERFGVTPRIDDTPCIIAPPPDPIIEARLQAAEQALVAEQASRAAAEARRLQETARDHRLAQSLLAAAALGAVASLVGLGMVLRAKLPTPYRITAVVAAGLFTLVAIGAYSYDVGGRQEPPSAPPPPVGPSVDAAALSTSAPPQAAPAPWGADAEVAFATTNAGGPSFDCRKARSFAETTICADPRLAARDASLAALYEKALQGPSASIVKAEALAAWHQREACLDFDCVVAWYDRREVELSRVATRPTS